MSTQKNKKSKKDFILRGLRNALLCDAVGVVILTVIGVIVALFKHSYIMRSIYMSYYFGGGIILMVAVPQFYKKSARLRMKGMNTANPMFGFYDWFGADLDEEKDENYENFKNDSFWQGIIMVFCGTVLILFGVLMESIFFA